LVERQVLAVERQVLVERQSWRSRGGSWRQDAAFGPVCQVPGGCIAANIGEFSMNGRIPVLMLVICVLALTPLLSPAGASAAEEEVVKIPTRNGAP